MKKLIKSHCLISVFLLAMSASGCGGGSSNSAPNVKPDFTLPNVISAVPPQQ